MTRAALPLVRTARCAWRVFHRRLALLAALTLLLAGCIQTSAPPAEPYLPGHDMPALPDEIAYLLIEPMHVNSGGGDVAVPSGSWLSDRYAVGGFSYTNTKIPDIAGTDDDAIYRTERASTTNLGGFEYRVPVTAPGTYRVDLHFAEIYWGATGGGPGGTGKRVFSVNLEGGAVELEDYDITADVGVATAVVKTFDVAVEDCSLDMVFTASVNRPKLSAYRVERIGDAPDPVLPTDQPSVTGTKPANCVNAVARDSAIVADLSLPNLGGIDGSTLDTNSVQLYRRSDGAHVPGTVNTSGGNDSLVYQPTGLLDAFTPYVFEVTDALKDETGASFAPWVSEFTTGSTISIPGDPDVAWNRTEVYVGSPIFSLTIGPDMKLYGAGLDGTLRRWTIAPDGTLTDVEAFDALAGRAVIGMAFDPNDTTALFLWTTDNDSLFTQPADDFTGRVTRVRVASELSQSVAETYLTGLPRSAKDHLSNSIVFGPDGYLYLSQGSNSAMGEADNTWYNRPERLLSAAILRIDPTLETGLPLDVQTEAYGGTAGSYDPYAPGAPVQIFATGIRNAYDLVWHSNGYLYVPINGSNAGGSTPDDPATGVDEGLTGVGTQDDQLARIDGALWQAGVVQYFGHPNPTRGEWILNGGNPNAAADPYEVVQDGIYEGYPVGVTPDPDFQGFIYTFGRNRSPNGIIEYRSDAFGGKLANRLIVTEYSGGKDLLAISLDAAGDYDGVAKIAANLRSPLDVIEDRRNGNIYVAEYPQFTTEGYITLLAPADGISTNFPPVVDAGPDTIAAAGTPLQLQGSASDDQPLAFSWSKAIGPGSVAFSDPAALATEATFDLQGTYVLELRANDGALDGYDAVTVEVGDTAPPPPPTDDAIRINAGGPAITTGGVAWLADQDFSGGFSYSNANIADIAATTDDVLYKTERASTTDRGSFAYAIPLAAGSYEVRLHFAEIYWGATGGRALTATVEDGYLVDGGVPLLQAEAGGERVFSVDLEGAPAELVNYDINALVGPETAIVETFVVDVSDGMLDIAFSASANRPKISAIEILPASP